MTNAEIKPSYEELEAWVHSLNDRLDDANSHKSALQKENEELRGQVNLLRDALAGMIEFGDATGCAWSQVKMREALQATAPKG